MAHFAFIACLCITFGALPDADEQVSVTLPDFGAELRAFDEPDGKAVGWWPHIINAGWGGGRGGPERNGGWLDKNWILIDYLDRSADYTTHEYLKHRGIWYEVYGSNEYQETIHFHEDGARELLWDNGIARDMNGERVLSQHYNMKVDWWAERIGWNAYIVCNNAPRWWAIINYDWLTSPLLGFAISQDNIGGPTSRIGAGGHGRYCDHCNARFFHHLKVTNRLPEFRQKYDHIRDYVQDNLMDVIQQLPPYTKHRFNEEESELLSRLCEPPVMSEYQKFLYLSHLHNFVRYYRDAKLLAERTGREYDVHGNQGGGFIGPNPYQVALSDFVDTVWFESSGLSTYDIFRYGWNNAWGSFRYIIGRAMTRGRRPFMSMTRFHKRTPDIVEHEMAEACAGGGVLFVNQVGFEEQPQFQQKMTDYFRFRHGHRALFAQGENQPYAQVAVAHSIPTMMYHNYQYEAAAEPINALSGIARALEEGHIPFDVLIFRHPEIHADRVALDDLKRYQLVILPALECLTDSQIELLTQYLEQGGTLGLIRQSGIRDEDNIPRSEPPLEKWHESGKVVQILPGENFLPCRSRENDRTRELSRIAIESTRKALNDNTIISGDLPRMLWVKAWQHEDDFISLHFVNYDVDFESGEAIPTEPAELKIALPNGVPAEEAAWFVPGGENQPLTVDSEEQKVTVTIPSVRVYGVLIVGSQGLERKRSAILQGDALMARAEMAADGDWGDLAEQTTLVRDSAGQATIDEAEEYAKSAEKLLQAIQQMKDEAYFQRIQQAVVTDGAIHAFDFGGKEEQELWQVVGLEDVYSQEKGFGWLQSVDDSMPSPEEQYYAMAEKYGGKVSTEITSSRLLFWPYKEQPPAPLRTNLACGSPRRFRVDVPAGDYSIRVVTTNPSWTNRNFLVSGMVSVNGSVQLLDAVHDRGAILAREFSVPAPDGKLEFTFGGPTGWAVAALIMRPGSNSEDDALVVHGLRTWYVSPRYANPDWYPITQVSCTPEKNLGQLPVDDWTEVKAPPAGIPVVDLGTNTESEVGDIVYAVAKIQASTAETVSLNFAASSQAQIWLNGKQIGYIPNEKGLRRDEFVAALKLREGENTLVVKLQRFWERHWMFYASLTSADKTLD